MNREALIEKMARAVCISQDAVCAESRHDPCHTTTLVHVGEAVNAALTAITEAGMVVVPREPTQQMLQAGMIDGCRQEEVSYDESGIVTNLPGISVYPYRVYKAMLAAAEKG